MLSRFPKKTVAFTTMAFTMALTISGCASVPNGPSAMALPGTGKSFDQFRADDNSCRQFALSQTGGTTATQAGNDSFAKTAVLGTALGAAVGAAAGGGPGAGVGAAAGLLFGSAIGANESQSSAYNTQDRYDNAYIQCMYASGHKVPVSASFASQLQQSNRNQIVSPANAASIPPPPPSGRSSAYP